MPTKDPNRFQFINGARLPGVTVLNATMADFSYGSHAHDEVAIGVTLGGVQEFTCRGSRFQSCPGGIMFFSPGDVHNGNPGDHTVLTYTMLYIDPAGFLPLVGAAADGGAESRFPEIHFQDAVLGSLILEMAGSAARDGGSTIEYEYGLYRMAQRLALRAGRFQPAARRDRPDALLLRVRDYINDNITEDISVGDLSRVANMSKFHFIRLFRDQFGLTPHRYVLNRRINRARLALETGRAPSDVAQDLAFFDVSHLNRHFKRVYGLTPKQYQLQSVK